MKIEIWGEGFSCTGNKSKAIKVGDFEAENFDKAMAIYISENPNLEIHTKEVDGKKIYTNWGCRYFDNEADARKSFG